MQIYILQNVLQTTKINKVQVYSKRNIGNINILCDFYKDMELELKLISKFRHLILVLYNAKYNHNV